MGKPIGENKKSLKFDPLLVVDPAWPLYTLLLLYIHLSLSFIHHGELKLGSGIWRVASISWQGGTVSGRLLPVVANGLSRFPHQLFFLASYHGS